MALSPSAPTSPLPRQLLRYASTHLVAALRRPAPALSLPSAPRGVDVTATRSPPGRPGAPRPGSSGRVHATLAMATMMREPTPPGLPAQGGGGSTNAVSATAAAAYVVMRGPTPPGPPAQGGGGRIHAAPGAARVAVRGPSPPGGR